MRPYLHSAGGTGEIGGLLGAGWKEDADVHVTGGCLEAVGTGAKQLQGDPRILTSKVSVETGNKCLQIKTKNRPRLASLREMNVLDKMRSIACVDGLTGVVQPSPRCHNGYET